MYNMASSGQHHANKLSIISEEIVPSETTFALKYYLKTTEETHLQTHRLQLPRDTSRSKRKTRNINDDVSTLKNILPTRLIIIVK